MLHKEVAALVRDPARFLDRLPSVYDWGRLGCFTGSRLGEYGQSKPRPGEPFATVPSCADAGEWAGTPLAFIRDDFTFYDGQRRHLDIVDLSRLRQLAEELHVRFRFDKSVLNFTIRKFRRMRGSFMCPVDSAISILRRAHLLQVPQGYPIGVFRCPTTGSFRFICGSDISSVMQYACRMAYPDINHYMRHHIDRIMAHSNRVTACLALH